MKGGETNDIAASLIDGPYGNGSNHVFAIDAIDERADREGKGYSNEGRRSDQNST